MTVSARGSIRVGGKAVVDEGIAGMVASFSVSWSVAVGVRGVSGGLGRR